MDGRGIAAALALGATAVQMGTAFLVTTESGAPPCYKQRVLAAVDESTVLTTAFSGRPARGIANGFTHEAAEFNAKPLPYPWQNVLTRPIRKAAITAADPEALSLWAGQGAALAKEQSVKELVSVLRDGLRDTVSRLCSLGSSTATRAEHRAVLRSVKPTWLTRRSMGSGGSFKMFILEVRPPLAASSQSISS
jgi:nitronate monooxygenase